MKINIYDGVEQAAVSKAILLYTRKGRFSSNDDVIFASLHEVADTGTKARPNVQIMPGSPITRSALLAALGSLSDEYLYETELVPESLLSQSPKHLTWWRPAGKKVVFFDCKELGKRSAIVPHPALVFHVSAKGWHVLAMKESVRPTLETPLFHSPYFNVYDDGKICVGSAAIPEKRAAGTIPEWESAFFESAFTHVNGRIRKVSHPRGEYAFWKEMLDGVFETFPTEMMVPLDMTLANLLKGGTPGDAHG